MATYPIRQLADNGGTAQFVPVTAPEAVQFPDGSNLNTFIGSVATIESNPVAANHAVGEFLCINGQVYEVIDAITAGDSISLDENVQVANLGSRITALDGKRIRMASHTITTDGNGAAILPNTYAFGVETGKRMLISVSIANTLKTCSNPGIASNGYPYVHVRNYDGSNCASIAVTLYCYYVQY